MVGSGGDDQALRPGLRAVAGVVATGLAVAALLSAASVVTQSWEFFGGSIGDRVVDATLGSLLAAGITFAATVAARCAGSHEVRAAAWVRGSIATVSTAAVAVSAYSAAAFLFGRWVGVSQTVDLVSWPVRLGDAAGELAVGLVGAAALWVLLRDRYRAPSGDLPEWRFGTAPIVCVVLASVALVSEIASSSVSIHGAGFSDRLANASYGFTSLPLAIAVLATAMFLAARPAASADPGDPSGGPVLIASILGILIVIAAVYAIVYTAMSHSSASGEAALIVRGWAARTSSICDALAAGIMGAAAVYVTWRLPLERAADREPATGSSAPQRRSVLVVGTLLSLAAAAAAILDVTFFASSSPVPISDRIVQLGSLVLLTAGLTLAAAIALRAYPADPDRPTGRAVVLAPAAVAVVALATLAVSGYAIAYALAQRGSARLSLVANAGMAQRISYASTAAASAFVAVGALLVLGRDRARRAAST